MLIISRWRCSERSRSSRTVTSVMMTIALSSASPAV